MNREEAINNVKSFIGQLTPECQDSIRTLVPELRESEDERIRKDMIAFLKSEKAFQTIELPISERWIAYLEKQKEPENVSASTMAPPCWTKVPEQCLKCNEYEIGYKAGYEHGCTAGYNKAMKEVDEQKEQKPAECIEDSVKFEEGFKTGRESGLRDGQKYVLDNAESYGLCKPAEWSEEDEKMLNLTKTQLRILQSHLSHTHSESMSDMEYSSKMLTVEQCVSWLDIRLKSLRPQHRDYAITFWTYLDEHRPEGKMCLSNGECADIEKAFIEHDWGKIIRYANKYQPHWKPSGEQMGALSWMLENARANIDFDPLKDLYEQLKSL